MLPQMSLNYRGFYETWHLLNKVTDLTSVDVYTIPWIVNGAFACELGLKYILTQNNISFKREHCLHILFNLLPMQEKLAIFKVLQDKYPNYCKEQFNRDILLISDAFCNFRYTHEHSLTLNLTFCKVWFEAIFNQVATYPSYKLVECTDKPDITMDELDKKILKTQNEMLSELKKKENSRR